MGAYIAPYEICPLAAGKGNFALPVDRPVDRTNGHFYDRCASGRPPGRPRLDTESRALCRSTDPVDRPTSSSWRARLCTSVDCTGRPTSATVDRSGRPTDN